MENITKEDAKKYINSIINFIDSGEVRTKSNIFYGHPGFYFFRTKEELDSKIDQYLDKDFYDKYDIYYIANSLIKYMLEKYDSHTTVKFSENNSLPIRFKIQNERVYIINLSPDLDDMLGSIVLEINGISIYKIMEELEKIICYSTPEFLHNNQESYLRNWDVLRALPCMDNQLNTLTFKILHHGQEKEICFSCDNLLKPLIDNKPENYSYEVIDDCIIIHYNSSRDREKMDTLIKNINVISTESDIENYIIDLRNNAGGDSSIIQPLVSYLDGKNIVTLINEKVFSSGRMAFVELKKIGAYSIGTDIATSLNCFGNAPGAIKIKELDLTVYRSSTYWLYNDKFECKGYRKDSFSKYFEDKRHLLEPVILHPDFYVDLSVDDIIHNRDLQLETALQYFNKTKRK